MPTIQMHACRAGVLMLMCAGASAQPALRAVALTGQQAPGAPAGVAFAGFEQVRFNDAGQVAFVASLQGAGVGNDRGIYLTAPGGALVSVVRTGEAAPMLDDGVDCASLGELRLNDRGELLVSGAVAGAGVDPSSDGVVWRRDADGAFTVLVRTGAGAPGTPAGTVFTGFRELRLNNNDDASLYATIAGPGIAPTEDLGLWKSIDRGTLRLVARESQRTPFLPIGTFVTEIRDGHSLSAYGTTSFACRIGGENVTPDNENAVVQELLPTLILLVFADREGTLDEGTGVFDRFDAPVMNDESPAGNLSYRFYRRGFGIDQTNDSAISTQASATTTGGEQRVTREGTALADLGIPESAGVVLGELGRPVLADRGPTLFAASLAGDVTPEDDGAIVRKTVEGAASIVVREGDAAPGTGAVFASVEAPAVDFRGRIALLADLAGPGVDGANDKGLWAERYAGAFELVVRTGDTLDVDSDPVETDLRTVASIAFDSADGFNDAGQLCIVLTFVDGSAGVFVSDPYEEPCSADFDEDGDVDLGDFGLFGGAFGSELGVDLGNPGFDPIADFDGDDDVDLGDFGAFGEQFGRTDCLP
ncbi:MAG: hypothetical protein Tsb0013_08400 [Phycisphaerales bacterium]